MIDALRFPIRILRVTLSAPQKDDGYDGTGVTDGTFGYGGKVADGECFDLTWR